MPARLLMKKSRKYSTWPATTLDNFRRFVLESKFLDVFDVDPETIAAIKEDDVALMKFAFKYLKYLLVIEQSLKLKEQKSESAQPPA